MAWLFPVPFSPMKTFNPSTQSTLASANGPKLLNPAARIGMPLPNVALPCNGRQLSDECKGAYRWATQQQTRPC
ncbi:MAG: hypothetical protein E6J91_44995 [Deltaproteobacteria bacterium]|nr:MAG: hypothetical protein E6J91_44995 [Deltaproteobacteria bacterium]